jgi:addiction module RelE/StbE family toxin
MTIRYSRRALWQLASLHEYLAARNPSAETKVAWSIRETVARLRELPLLGKQTDEPRVHLLIEPRYLYRVFYRVEGQTIFIIRVLHRSQERP